MKNKAFFLLSAAALLALGACGGNKNTSSGGNSGGGQGGSDAYIPEPYVDPEVNLSDFAAPNMEIDFDKVTDTCMVNKQAKAYIDAMEEQEKTLAKPYHFSSLYGPDDYAKIAAEPDKGDGTTYSPADTGGVDVCQYLKNSDDSGYCKNYPIQLTWDDDGSFEDATVKFWSKEDKSDARDVKVSVTGGKATASLDNLFRATKYRAQVFNGDDVSNSFEFKTGDYPRTISMGGIKNVRDIGGYVTSYGVRTNQGLIYRGYYIDDGNPSSHGKNYNAETQRVQDEIMQIGYELDLQTKDETKGRTKSAISTEELPVEYQCLTLVSYENFLKQNSFKNLPAVFKILANAEEKHVYFHCYGGADRTGMLDFFISAILGVSYTDLVEQFELTTQTNNKRCHMHNSSNSHFPKFLNAFINGYTDGNLQWDGYDPEATVNENCEKWLTEVAEVDPDDIEKIREIMLPGYADGNLDVNKLIPKYTIGDEWETDELAHWQVSNEDPDVIDNWGRHKLQNGVCTVCGEGEPEEDQGGEEGETDYLKPLGRVWSVTKKENNADGKEYEQVNDAAKNKVGVRILFTNYSPDSTATVSGGKLEPQNNDTVYLIYRIKAPKAGTYQMIMNGRVSDDTKTLNERSFKVTLNGANVDVQGDRKADLTTDGDNDFVAAPSINLTGNEDVITVACPDYRIKFLTSSYITFAEH